MSYMTRWISITLVAVWVAALAPTPAAAQSVSRGPYLQLGTPDRVVVRWRTDVATDSRVTYGSAPGSLTSAVGDAFSRTEHEITLSSLLPDSVYYYAVGTTTSILAGNDASHFFLTAPTRGTQKPTRIWVLGDSGTASSSARAVRDAYYAFAGTRHTDLWLMLGDNAYSDGTDSQYQAAVFNMYPEMLRKSVLWPTLGNHDGHSADSATQSGPYYDIFTLPRNAEAGGVASGTEAYYSFDYGNIHFIVLDSFDSDRSPGGAMMTWLQTDLAATTQDWIIAFWHHPPYSKGSHDSDTSSGLTQMRQNALPLLEQGGVDLVLAGHSHSYERSFLLDGHYGTSGTLVPSMILDGGDGRPTGNGAYEKATQGPAPHLGAVYTVAGSSGSTGGGALNHPVMYISLNVLGSLVLDVGGNRLDATFLQSTGAIGDTFTIQKGVAGNTPPVAVNDSAMTFEDTPVSISVLSNDTDANVGDVLTVASVTQPSKGIVTINAGNTTVTYTPAANFNGTNSFTYTASDGRGGKSTATVNVTVFPVNDPPSFTKGPDQTVLKDAGLQTVVGWATNISPGPTTDEASQVVNFIVNSTNTTLFSVPPAVAPNGTLTYTTATNATGSATVTVQAHDNGGTANGGVDTSAPQTFTITVTSSITVNPPGPITTVEIRVAASSDDAEENSSGGMSLTSSDLELVYDGGIQKVGMRFNGVGIPQGATIVKAYVQFKVDEVNSEATSLTIQGHKVAQAPTFTTTSGNISSRPRTSAAVLWSPVPPWTTVGAAGPDQRTPEIAPVIQEIVNQAGWSSGNSLALIITGTGHRTAESYDGDRSGAPLLHVEWQAAGGNTPPVAVVDDAATNEDTPVAINVLGNDSDPDGDALSVASVTQPGNGSATINADNTVTYAPKANFNGVDSFTYTASDGRGGQSTATVTVTVNPVNDAPVANSQSVTTPKDTAVPITLTASDADGDPLAYSVVTSPTNGSLSGTAPNLTYTPSAGFSGSNSFTFQVSDGIVNSNVAAVSITVTAATPDTTAPVISGVAASAITVSGATISWTTNEPSDTQVEYGTTTAYGSSTPLNSTLVTSHSTTLSGLAAGTLYDYRVKSKDAAGNLAVSGDFTFTTAAAPDTGLQSPTANAPVTSSAGDNNGFESNPANAHANDGVFAVDTNSGTSSSTGCTSSKKDKHLFYNYNFSIPAGSTIKGIEVRLDAKVDSTSGSPKLCVQLSWDGGVTWTTAKSTPTLTTSEATYVLGSASDLWGRTWAVGDFDNTSFRVRVISVASSTSRDFSLDWVAVRVYQQ